MKARQSNFELLRLVAMFMIVFHHVLIKGAQTVGYTHPFSLDTDGVLGVYLNSLVVG